MFNPLGCSGPATIPGVKAELAKMVSIHNRLQNHSWQRFSEGFNGRHAHFSENTIEDRGHRHAELRMEKPALEDSRIPRPNIPDFRELDY